MVEGLLEFAKMQRAELKPNFNVINLNEFLTLICNNVRAQCKSDIYLKTDSEISLPIDQSLMSKAIKNLIINAEKYGKNTIYVSVQKSAGRVLINVEDDGLGVDTQNSELIFQPYFRYKKLDARKTLFLNYRCYFPVPNLPKLLYFC